MAAQENHVDVVRCLLLNSANQTLATEALAYLPTSLNINININEKTTGIGVSLFARISIEMHTHADDTLIRCPSCVHNRLRPSQPVNHTHRLLR